MERIQAEEQKLEKLEQQEAEAGRLDVKDAEDVSGLQKKYEQMLRDAEPLAALQKVQASIESIEKRRRDRATIREGLQEQATISRARIAELEQERFIGGKPQRVAAMNKAAATLTHDLAAHLEQFTQAVNENVLTPARMLQQEGQVFAKGTGREVREERVAFRLRAFVTDIVKQAEKILEDIHREAQR